MSRLVYNVLKRKGQFAYLQFQDGLDGYDWLLEPSSCTEATDYLVVSACSGLKDCTIKWKTGGSSRTCIQTILQLPNQL